VGFTHENDSDFGSHGDGSESDLIGLVIDDSGNEDMIRSRQWIKR
jgi:hypothetical protein